MSLLKFTSKGIFCPQGNFYIDPWHPVDCAVITHGHGDHARPGMTNYLCHEFTKPILQTRISPDVSAQSLRYREKLCINGVTVSMYPAGHIVGSAQIKLEYKGFTSVVTGDYKIENDGLSTPFEPLRCNELVTESTFGLPIYNWLPQSQIFENITEWITKNKAQGKTSVFIAYSLGKAQRLIVGLQNVAAVFVHSSINRLNLAIEEAGVPVPATALWQPDLDRSLQKGNIIILPPSLLGTNVISRIPNAAIAICSGWMQVRGHRRWQNADAGFAVSDHADWTGLLNAVKETHAEKVFVTHGFTSTFSKYLNEIGILSEEVKTQFGNDEETLPENYNKTDISKPNETEL